MFRNSGMKLLFGAIAILIAIVMSSEAFAGTEYFLYITNNSNVKITLRQEEKEGKETKQNWYLEDFSSPHTVSPKSSARYRTQQCSNFPFCTGESHLTLEIFDGDISRKDVRVHFKGSNGTFPNWPGKQGNFIKGVGGVYAANADKPSGAAVMKSMSCRSTDSDVTCDLFIDDGVFYTTNSKYITTEPVENSRRYFVSNNLKTDGVVLNANYRALTKIRFNSTGRVEYEKKSSLSPTSPYCATSSDLYVVLENWDMFVMPVCYERIISNLPLFYTDTGSWDGSGSGQIEKIDKDRTFQETFKDGRLMITHGGLAGAMPVRAAGEISIDISGKVLWINNDSGHYQPNCAALDAAVTYFADKMGAGGAFVGARSSGGTICTYATK